MAAASSNASNGGALVRQVSQTGGAQAVFLHSVRQREAAIAGGGTPAGAVEGAIERAAAALAGEPPWRSPAAGFMFRLVIRHFEYQASPQIPP